MKTRKTASSNKQGQLVWTYHFNAFLEKHQTRENKTIQEFN